MNIHLINFLIKLKNASYLKKESVTVLYNKNLLILINILYHENFIQAFKYLKKNNSIQIFIKYLFNKNLLKDLIFLSTSSKKQYVNFLSLCLLVNKNNFLLLSTTYGFLTDLQCKQLKVGGKLFFIS